eukprot:CAMPEP_0117050756 /NCGR_PEP_ID=MMETSP0472-20121206/35045_1 /TAXON_ID=693140 ORGANISM="Tiarina fusus, Strain LIS" /NCGR_SAMPLE_ID=MMETSP0472 /ASSEMBLY_ACC=CAM_ASM_000603 /LENGTH=209 /DNA_ID=CAMNT_0004764661 /DNA_START=369 /DNA_END=998 /DNA_ORIENTATION=+
MSCNQQPQRSPAAINATASSSRIRSRYLHRLGLTSSTSSSSTPSKSSKRIAPLPASITWGTTRRQRPDSTELLKTDHGKKDDSLTLRTTTTPPASAHHSSVVRFQPHVIVHTIPHHSEYSTRVKRTLWMPPAEIEAMVTRNAIEFASERWDWRRATEEEDFVRLSVGGGNGNKMVHPAHVVQPRCNMQRQFLMIMSARQQQQRQQAYHR